MEEQFRVLVCGGRDLDESTVWNWLEHQAPAEIGRTITCIIQGGASGADRGAEMWAKSERRCSCITYPANWKKYGKRAGPIRNQRMIDEGKPDLVVAFPGGKGTADMVQRARNSFIKVLEVRHVRPQTGGRG